MPRNWKVSFFVVGVLTCAFLLTGPGVAQQAPPVPTADDVRQLMQREPLSMATWPMWRPRLLGWINDRSDATDAAFLAARDLFVQQATAKDELPRAVAQDAFAWYLLGSGLMRQLDAATGKPDPRGATRAEAAFRRSLQLDPKFAPAHRNLALVLLLQSKNGDTTHDQEIEQELRQAMMLDPKLSVDWVRGQFAMHQKRYQTAELAFFQAMDEAPREVQLAHAAAGAILLNPENAGSHATRLVPLLKRFPDDGRLLCMHALALAADDQPSAAVKQLQRAREVGTDPTQILGPDLTGQIEAAARGPWYFQVGWGLLYVTGFYAVLISFMALIGWVLAARTRAGTLDLLNETGDSLLADGAVQRTTHETLLGRFYMWSLMIGLVFFYFAIPFVILGLLGVTGALLYLVFSLGRIPIKLVVIIVVVGLGMVWAVLKSLFASMGEGSFGLPKTSLDCPRLHELLAEVAEKVDTPRVDAVYVAPGAGIGVHQEGRGPFGVFGVKRRVLTLGLSTLHFLTIGELKAILAHEYAHFSHQDTFYSRFVYQVSLSIEQALQGMGGTAGTLNYVNPFYWFLYLYYRAYNLLSAGFSRSREFLADRMAAVLYGSDVFASALSKVSTDGQLFEMTIYQTIGELLQEGKAFDNMYAAFREYRENQFSGQERSDLYEKLLAEEGSLFARHPTFRERVEAVAVLPRARTLEDTPALQVFEQPEVMEKELTEFLTAVIYHTQQQAAAAQQQAAS